MKHYFVKDDLKSGVEEPLRGRGGTSTIKWPGSLVHYTISHATHGHNEIVGKKA